MSRFELSAACDEAYAFQKKFPKDSTSNMLLAQALVAKGDPQAAQVYAENANICDPAHPGINYFLGMLYIQLGIFEKAAPLISRGLKAAPNSALLHWAKAEMHMALNQGHDAVEHYELASQLQIDEERKSHLALQYAVGLASIGKHDEAERTLLSLKNIPGLSAKCLLLLAENPNHNSTSELKTEIETLISQRKLNGDAMSNLHLALGRLEERSGKYDQAFNNWTVAKSYQNLDFDHNSYEFMVSSAKKFYSSDEISAHALLGNSSELPVFIFGMPRSGTTLIEQIISAHPDAQGVGELMRIDRIEGAYFSKFAFQNTSSAEEKNATLKRDANEYLDLLSNMITSPTQRVVDKTLTSYFVAGFIHMCFPNARFINCIRHPADSFISAYQNNLDHAQYHNQEHYITFFLGKERLVEHWKSCFPEKIFDLHYEDLVSNPEDVSRKLFVFLDLAWDPSCLKFFEKSSTVRTLSRHQVRREISTSSVYRWKNYEKHLGPLFAALKAANFEYPEI